MENIELERRTTDLAVRARNLKVMDQESLTKASDLLLAGKELERAIKDFFAPFKAKAHAAWKELCDAEGKEIGKLVPIISCLNRSVADYKVEQEKKRREVEEEARRIEREKEVFQNEIDEKLQQTIEIEAAAAGRGDVKAVKVAQAESDRILAEAAKREKEMMSPPPIPETPKTDGLAMRENWDFEIVDEAAIPREYLIPDEVKIRKVIKIMKDKTNIPGIRVFNQPMMQRIGARNRQSRP